MMQTGEPLAYGRTAEVYPWTEGWVLKLFYDWFPSESIAYEARVAHLVHAAGLPVPAPGDTVNIDGRLGLLYQRVDGASMWTRLVKQPWKIASHARALAQLHAQMHAASLPQDSHPQLPDQRHRLVGKLNAAAGLGDELRQAALKALDELPGGDRLCHGDFHPGNVLLTPTGPVVIDWIDVTVGNPLADVARSSVLALGAAATITGVNAWLFKGITRVFHRLYLRHYWHLHPAGQDEYHRWIPVVAAARMSEDIADLQDWLRSQAQAILE